MIAREVSAVRLGDGFNRNASLAQVEDIGRPARGWLIDRGAALLSSLGELLNRPRITPCELQYSGIVVMPRQLDGTLEFCFVHGVAFLEDVTKQTPRRG